MQEDNNNNDLYIDPDVMVVAGGAVKGISILGAIQYAMDQGFLQNVSTMVGTSIGSAIIYLLAIGYNPTNILKKIISHKVMERLNASMNLTSVLGEGVLSYSHLQEVMEKMTIDKIGFYPTLKDIQTKFDKKLVITTYNLTKDELEYLSPETHPDLPCLTAIRMSSNIPFVFEQFKYMGSHYIDGGIADNFPIEMGLKCGKKLIGFYTVETTANTCDSTKVVSYMINLLCIMPRIRLKEVMEKYKENCTFIKIVDDNSMLNFNLTLKDKLDLFSLGYSEAKACLCRQPVVVDVPQKEKEKEEETPSTSEN